MRENFTRILPLCCVLLLTFLFSLWIKPLQAQVPELEKWDKTFGGWGIDKMTSMTLTADGGYLLAGYTSSGAGNDLTVGTKGSRSYWILKVDANGNKAWDKTFGAGGFDVLTAVVATKEGGFLLGGNSQSGAHADKTEASRGLVDFWVIKLDANGNKVWDKTLGGSFNEELYTLTQTSDGGYLLGGYSDSGPSGDKTEGSRGRTDYWVVKLHATGNKEWDRTFGGSEGEYLTALQNTTDGGFLLGGYSYSEASGDKSGQNKSGSTSEADFWVLKLDAAGNKVWDKTIGGNFSDYLYTLTLLPDGGFLLGGSSTSDAGGDKTENNKSLYFDGNRLDYWLVKLGANGEKIWDKTIGGNYEDRLSSLVLTEDGGYLLGGWSSSGASGDKTDTSRGGLDYWLVKLKPAGTKVWDKALGSSKDDYLQAMTATADGGYLLGGYSVSPAGGEKTGNAKGAEDYWLVKIKEKGSVLPSIVPVAQVWDKSFGGNQDDELSAMVAAEDGGYLLAGSSASLGPNAYKQYWTAKIKEDGTKEWDKYFLGNQEGILNAMIKTPDGGYLLGGHSTSGAVGDKTAASNGSWDYWIVKLNQQGEKVWDKTYGGLSWDYFSTIIATPDGGFLLGGSSWSGAGEDKTEDSRGGEDYWVVKLNNMGNKEWDKTLGGSGTDLLTSLVAAPDGGYLLGGYSYSDAGGDKANASWGGKDYWIVKLQADGSKAWDRTIGGSGEDHLSAMVVLADGNYLLGGSSDSAPGGAVSSVKKGYQDYWIVKVNANGYLVWDKAFGGHSSDFLTSMIATADGGFLLGGASESEGDADKSEARRGLSWGDYWVLKLKADATREWDKTFGGSGLEQLTSLLETADGSMLAGGYSGSGANGDKTQAALGQDDFWVVRFKSKLAAPLQPKAPQASDMVNCGPGQVTLKATGGTGGNYRWYAAATGGSPIDQATEAAYTTPFLSATTSYYVSLVNAAGGESARVKASAIINTPPPAPGIPAPEVTICQNAPAAALTAAGVNLKWYFSGPDGMGSTTAPTPSTATLGTTEYYVSQTLDGCEGKLSTITVTITAVPEASFVPFTKHVCSTITSFVLTGGQPAGGSYSGPGVTNGNFNAVEAGIGTHVLTYSYTLNGCTASATQNITVATCTGMEESETASATEIYPIPATDKVTAKVPFIGQNTVVVKIIDAQGKVVVNQTYEKVVGPFEEILYLKTLRRGVYLLDITTDNEKITKRIVLQ